MIVPSRRTTSRPLYISDICVLVWTNIFSLRLTFGTSRCRATLARGGRGEENAASRFSGYNISYRNCATCGVSQRAPRIESGTLRLLSMARAASLPDLLQGACPRRDDRCSGRTHRGRHCALGVDRRRSGNGHQLLTSTARPVGSTAALVVCAQETTRAESVGIGLGVLIAPGQAGSMPSLRSSSASIARTSWTC